MAKAVAVHEGVIHPGLVAQLEAFRAPDRLVSSYYLDLSPRPGTNQTVADALKSALAGGKAAIEQVDARPAIRHALRRDWDLVAEQAPAAIGDRSARGLACFVVSDAGYSRVVHIPSRIRNRVFFADRFVLWPLRQVLEQADRYAIILTEKDEARTFLFYLEKIEEVADILDELPGRIRFPDPLKNWHYQNKHVEYFHRHFAHVAEVGLRLFEREPFDHLIIGGLWEILPQFESHLHRYLRDRIVARWEIDVHAPVRQILERAQHEEQRVLERQAKDIWKTIQDFRPQRGALGPEEVFAALWGRRVQSMLIEPELAGPGFRCSVCGRLTVKTGPCPECGGLLAATPDVFEEAVQDAAEQSAQVRYWDDPALKKAQSIAALRRF
jgi:peptide chain release factor subunit 1